jgi:hypothetical protein
VAEGTPDTFKHLDSKTAMYLDGRDEISFRKKEDRIPGKRFD